jgi:hypothetical protein
MFMSVYTDWCALGESAIDLLNEASFRWLSSRLLMVAVLAAVGSILAVDDCVVVLFSWRFSANYMPYKFSDVNPIIKE